MEIEIENKVGSSFKHSFSFSQEEVNAFGKLTGDNNPLHWDENYAAQTIFKKPIIHGFLGASVFSKVLGTIFPAEGTVYLSQEMKFMRPMYVNLAYEAVFTIQVIDASKHRAVILTQVFQVETQKMCIDGKAEVMNEQKF